MNRVRLASHRQAIARARTANAIRAALSVRRVVAAAAHPTSVHAVVVIALLVAARRREL